MHQTKSSKKFYRVGGCIRDELMGRKSKDIDFACEADSFDHMKQLVTDKGWIIKVEKSEFFTLRCVAPDLGGVDVVLCRKDGKYTDGRHPDSVEIGTLHDDLSRRDFTMNSIAVGEDGTVYDPFGGREHIKFKLITCVGVAKDRFREDSIRMLRAVRFHIQLGFVIAPEIEKCFEDPELLKLLSNVSLERTRDELIKMFEVHTMRTMNLLTQVYPALGYTIFDTEKLWLKPTMRVA